MKIKEVMSTNVRQVPDTLSIRDAATVMRDQGIGLLAVTKDACCVGTVTDRDLVTRGLAEKHDPAKTKVRDVMSKELVSCTAEEDTDEAVRRMTERGVRRLLVLDPARHPTGVVSLSDIASRAHAHEAAGKALGTLAGTSRRI